jgi:hypothetical protein
VRARIAALQARADETLTLVARGDGANYEKDYTNLTLQLVGPDGTGGLLAEIEALASAPDMRGHINAAKDNAVAWLKAHTQVRRFDDAGQYQESVNLAIDVSKPDSAASAFLRLDENLVAAINVGRQEFVDYTRNADRALTALAPGIAVLAVIAAAGATIGIRERLREYR